MSNEPKYLVSQHQIDIIRKISKDIEQSWPVAPVYDTPIRLSSLAKDIEESPATTEPAPERDFWLVWSPTGHAPPKFKHTTFDAAETEAGRLARQNKGARFYVLHAVSVAHDDPIKNAFSVQELAKDGDIPF